MTGRVCSDLFGNLFFAELFEDSDIEEDDEEEEEEENSAPRKKTRN
jgi:hypothetical protein